MSETPSAPISSNWHVRLRRILVDYFSNDELQTLCFDLRVNYDDLEGNNQTQKAVSLINHLVRLGQIEQLIDLCREARPNVPWDDLRLAALQNPLLVDEQPDQAAGVAPVQRALVPSRHAGILPSPFMWAALALIVLAGIALLVWVVRAASRPPAESASGPQVTAGETTEAVTQAAVLPANVLVSEDFENGPAPLWRDVSSSPDLVVALPLQEPDGNHVLRLRQDVEALYFPAWEWDTADYRLEADVMVIDLTEDTSAGLNVRVVNPRVTGYCQGYRAEIGTGHAAIHRVTAPDCDNSVWQYDTLDVGSFALKAREWHHLRLDITGNRLRFFIDGELALVATDPEDSFPDGGVGLMVFNSDAVYVDNIVATDLSPGP